MWKVTISEYNKYAGESFDYSEVFADKQEAVNYCNSLIDKNKSIGIWIEELIQVDEDEYIDGNGVTCLQSVCYE